MISLNCAPGKIEVYSTDQYGIISEMYSYVAFLVVFLMYGLETAYFRFSSQKEYEHKTVFSTVVISIITTTALFITLCTIFAQPIAEWLMYPNNKEFVIWFAIIVGLDAISAIPLAKFRKENRAFLFTFVNLTNVFINIGLNLFFLAYCLPKYSCGETNFLIDTFYNPDLGVSYVFISNLIASSVKFLILLPFILRINFSFSVILWKKMMRFGVPLLLAGLAGIINETIDRIMLKRMLFDDLGEKATMSLIGIYSASYKISIIITLFIQAFRYAAEPFFFSEANKEGAKDVYSKILNWFLIVCLFIFLAVNFYLDWIKYFIPNPDFWVGLKVVPILLMANVFLGVYFNLSIWFKLTNKTGYGALMSVGGALITILLNFILIPKFNYVGSAIATLVCYICMVIASYILGNIHYPIPYNLKKVALYFILSLGLYFISTNLPIASTIGIMFVNTALLLVFIVTVYFVEFKKLKSV